MLVSRIFLLVSVTAAALVTAGVGPCRIYVEASIISGNCPKGYDQKEVGAGPGKIGFGTQCSRACTAAEENVHLSDTCANYIDLCRRERKTTDFCGIAHRDCLVILPQDVCTLGSSGSFYVFDEASKQCKSRFPITNPLLKILTPFLPSRQTLLGCLNRAGPELGATEACLRKFGKDVKEEVSSVDDEQTPRIDRTALGIAQSGVDKSSLNVKVTKRYFRKGPRGSHA